MNKVLLVVFISVVLFSDMVQAASEPVGWWVFDREHVQQRVVDQAGNHDAAMEASARFTEAAPRGMILDQTSAVISVPDEDGSLLPRREMTAAAWVSLDAGGDWGGIVSYMQDNGSFEKGWLLGYVKDKFCFAVSTAGTLTYMQSKTPFKKGQWYHVAGTYDGTVMKIYVNGRLENTSTDQKGNIDYPPKAFYTIGAYRDDNELYRMQGKLHEVRVYDKAISATEIGRDYQAKELLTYQPLEFKVSPALQFLTPDSAKVFWETQQACKAVLEYGVKGGDRNIVTVDSPNKSHQAIIKGLEPGTEYSYRIKTSHDGDQAISDEYEFDTAFNYCLPTINPERPPWADNDASKKIADLAKKIISETGISKGYCLVYGCDNGQLAYELARQSELIIVGVDEDRRRVTDIRRRLIKAGVYGGRITIRQVDSLEKLPLTSNFANLIVTEHKLGAGEFPGSTKELYRVLRPGGGVAYQKGGQFPLYEKPPLEGIGTWSHQYGSAGNSCFGGEQLNGVTGADGLQVQWIGRPGADFGIDRNPRMPAPLAVGGRLYHQGLNRMIAMDSYNGAILWSLEAPGLRRVNMPRDASNWCGDQENVYVEVSGQCWVLDGLTGNRKAVFTLPNEKQRQTHDWNYMARYGNLLYGSSVKKGSAFTNFWGGDGWYDKREGPGAEKICSDSLFACDPVTGNQFWNYTGGAVINTTISISDGRVYFVESRHPKVTASATGRIGTPELWQEQYLVALDAISGSKLWEKSIDTADGTVVFFMIAANDSIIIASSSPDRKYHLYCHDGNSGQERWRNEHKWPSDNHSGHMQHPVMVGQKVFLEPCGYDLKTGKLTTDKMGRHEGCATYAATTDALLYRGQSRRIAMWDIETEQVSSWFNLRPSCWLSVIPAGGMILAPEGGGGCSCGNWLETSLGFAPWKNN